MQTPNMPILLADAHTFCRIGLYQVLADVGFKIVGEVNSVEELRQQLNEHTAPFLLPALVDAGVTGMVAKMESTQTLVQTILTAAAGRRAISPMVMDRMLHQNPQPEIILDTLEEKLMQLVCAEKTNLEIAEILNLSHKTVEKWLTALYTKLGVRSRTGAALWFERCYDLEGFPS